MIYIAQQYTELFKGFDSVDDFLNIDMQTVRDFKNRKTGRFEINGQGFYIKKHFECGLPAILDELFHLRKPHIGAGHERSVLDRLEQLNISSMKVAAFGQDGKNLVSQRSFLVTQELTQTQSLEDICRDWPSCPPEARFKIELIKHVAAIAKKMHDNGINHRDFYICHFLIDIANGQQCVPPRLYLIDLHRAQQREQVPMRWRVKDIGALYFSAMDIGLTRTDMLRFVKEYTAVHLKQTLKNDRAFWMRVAKRAERMYRRDFGRRPNMKLGISTR